MDLWLFSYYLGGVFAIALCWGLGRIFYIPMIISLGVEVLLGSGVLSQVDIRPLFVVIGFLYTLWVVVLSGVFRDWFEGLSVFAFIAISFAYGIYPTLVDATQDWDRWTELTTRIIKTWMLVIVGIVITVVARSGFSRKAQGGLGDLVVNPRKRFLIPLGLWAGIIVVPLVWVPGIGVWLETNRYHLAGNTLVWGWVLFELKFFVQARYWRRIPGK